MRVCYWRHFILSFTHFCRLSCLLATLCPVLHLILSPIPLIDDTLPRPSPYLVAYPAYWRHFAPSFTPFCRLSRLLATLCPVLHSILSPIPSRLLATPYPCHHKFFVANRHCHHIKKHALKSEHVICGLPELEPQYCSVARPGLISYEGALLHPLAADHSACHFYKHSPTSGHH